MAKPSDAALAAASIFYYTDTAGAVQGPFDRSTMHSWYAAGYLPLGTAVAPSLYGEVPEDFFPIRELWADGEQAFGGAAAVATAAASAAMLAPMSANGGADDAASGNFESGSQRRAARPGPYDRPSIDQGGRGRGKGGAGSGKGGASGKGGGAGKGRGSGGSKGGGKGDGNGKGGKPPHMMRFEAARAAGLGLVGGSTRTGGGMAETRNPWVRRERWRAEPLATTIWL